jgi:hypothetical protein
MMRNMNSFTMFMLIAAAVAATLAVAAIVVGQRRSEPRKAHALHGILHKRIDLFNTMANRSTLCGTGCVERPDRRSFVEMTSSTDDYLKQGPPPSTYKAF